MRHGGEENFTAAVRGAAADSELGFPALFVSRPYPGFVMLLRLAAGIVIFASLLPSQEESDVRVAERQGEAERRMKAREKGETGEEAGLEDEKNLTPEQRLARHVISGASQYCRLHISVTPPKLLPGQSGTVKVLMAFQGKAVLPVPPPLELVGAAQQGMLSLGAYTLSPAPMGKLASAYLGRPVYDNYAVLEMPVTMSPSAALGSRHVVAVDLKFDLYDGSSGQPINRFLDRVSTEVDVGTVPDPAVRGGAKKPVSEPRVVAQVPPAKVASAATEPAGSTPALQGNVITPAATAATSEPAPSTARGGASASDGSLPVEDAGGDLPMPLLIGGGVLLLGIVLLLARKK